MNQEIKKLQNRIADLEKQVRALSQFSTIPLAIENAFTARGFINASKPGYPDTNFDYTTNEGFRQTIVLSGSAQSISVPAFPLRFMRLKDGSNFFIPLYTYAEFGF